MRVLQQYLQCILVVGPTKKRVLDGGGQPLGTERVSVQEQFEDGRGLHVVQENGTFVNVHAVAVAIAVDDEESRWKKPDERARGLLFVYQKKLDQFQ